MKFKTLTKTLGIIGTFIICMSTLRWFLIYYDPSQAVLGVSIGVIVVGFAYIYQTLCELIEDIKDTNKGLDNLNMWFRDELNKMEKKCQR